MPRFWLGTNVFITPKNAFYSFDIAPGFWAFIDEQAASKEIATSSLVYDELVTETDDELAKWARDRKDGPLFVRPSETVESALTRIADHVKSAYAANQARDFLHGADPWVIAHALADGGSVVSLEREVPPTSKKAKIPNVCEHFGVEYPSLFGMLRQLGLRL